jgi:sialidase-1
MRSPSSKGPTKNSSSRGLLGGSGLLGACVATIVIVALAVAPVLAVADSTATPATSVAVVTPVFSPETTSLYSSSPFVSDPTHKIWYRLPAIIRNAQGDLLAFAEKRDNDASDNGNFDVVMRRSTDGGRNWGLLRTIANDGKNRVSNPVPMLDPLTGDVLLITSIRRDKGRIFIQRSSDGGSTFSGLSEIRPRGDWKGGLTGPGHAVVLAQGDHAGRIVVAMGYSNSTTGKYGAYGLYSDDGGKSWAIGYDSGFSGTIGYMEGTIAEQPNGDLLIGYRDKKATTPGKTRLYAISSDGGETLSTSFRLQSAIKIHSVEGSLLNLSGTHSAELLFSAPTYTSAADRSLRRDMGIFLSKDGGTTWCTPYQVELESKPAAYSDLVQLTDSTVGILYETGTQKWRERIRFRQIRLSEIASPTKVPSYVKAKLNATTVTTRRAAAVRIAVAVAGIGSPSGQVVVKFTHTSLKSGTRTVTLTYSNRGKRYVKLPRLRSGKYTISVTYKGTSRVKSRTVSAGSLRVKK